MKRAFIAAIAIALWVASPSAAQASPRSRLIYSRSPEAQTCPDDAALHRAVMARVGYDPFFAWADRTVIAAISKRGEELVGRVEVVDANGIGQGAREITAVGSDCGVLFETLALTIAIAIDPHALARKEEPPAEKPQDDRQTDEPSPSISAPDVRNADRPREAALPPSPPSPPPLTLRLATSLRGDVGTQPGPAPGLSASIALERSRFALGVEVASSLPTTTGVETSAARVRGWLLRSSILPCVRWAQVNVCGLASIGRFEGSAENANRPTTQSSLFVAAGTRVGFELPISAKVAVTFDAEIAANLYRTTLMIGTEAIWRAPPMNGGLGAGIAARF